LTLKIGRKTKIKMKELEIISKTGKINNSAERIFYFFDDFRNITKLIPPEAKAEVENWHAEKDWCSFVIKGQSIQLNIVEREKFKTIKITGDDKSPYVFNFWIQLAQLSAYETAVRLVLRAKLNLFMRQAVKKPMQKGLDQIIDYMKMIPY